MSSDKVKELAELAECSIDGMGYGEGNIERFAELLVRECIEIVEASKVGFSQVPAEVALDLTAKNIKAYFGLK